MILGNEVGTACASAEVQRLLASMPLPASDFDEELHAQCGAMVDEAWRCTSTAELQASPLCGNSFFSRGNPN